jgi:RNA polymerase sigma factor (sigma-70 family)
LEGSNTLEDLLSFEEIHKLIHGAAKRWARSWQNKRIPFEDFLSVFYEKAWEVIQDYTWATDFYLYETISEAINKRGKDLVRQATRTDRRKAFHEAYSLKEGFEDFYPDPVNVAQLVTDRLYKEQVLQDPELTDRERRVLLEVYKGGSQREIAGKLGKDRKTVSRTMDHLRHKLDSYRTTSA